MRADLHIHTDHSSDSKNSVKDIIRILRSRGINGAAFIDHNTPDGGREALSLREDGFLVVPGIEVSSSEGHILALNVRDPIKRDMGVVETIEKIHDLGGIAIAVHPYRAWSGLGEKNVIGMPFDGVETLNARSNGRSNSRAVRLADKVALAQVAGSDSHENDTLGQAYTVFPEGTETVDDVIQAILGKKTKVEGRSRTRTHTVGYVTKSVSEWMGRGMRRM